METTKVMWTCVKCGKELAKMEGIPVDETTYLLTMYDGANVYVHCEACDLLLDTRAILTAQQNQQVEDLSSQIKDNLLNIKDIPRITADELDIKLVEAER